MKIVEKQTTEEVDLAAAQEVARTPRRAGTAGGTAPVPTPEPPARRAGAGG